MKFMKEFGFELADYFHKYGFDDGIEEYVGTEWKESVEKFLDKRFKELKLPVHCEPIDIVSSHNNCRITLYETDATGEGFDLDVEFSDSSFKVNSPHTKFAKEIEMALADMAGELDALFSPSDKLADESSYDEIYKKVSATTQVSREAVWELMKELRPDLFVSKFVEYVNNLEG